MTSPTESTILRAFGLHRVPDFITQTEAQEVIASANDSTHEPATIYDPEDREFVKPQTRLTTLVHMPADAKALIRSRLESQVDHFAQLCAIEEPLELGPVSLLRYGPGDFFARHRDANPGRASGRRISAVLMLSTTDPSDPNHYEGGEFVVFPPGLSVDQARTTVGIPTSGDVGELFVFESTMFHEIKPVIAGLRHTVVAWFVGRS